MSDGGKKKPFGTSFLNLAISLFFGVILLTLTFEMLKQIWWLLALIGLGVATVAALRWFYARKKRWDDH